MVSAPVASGVLRLSRTAATPANTRLISQWICGSCRRARARLLSTNAVGGLPQPRAVDARSTLRIQGRPETRVRYERSFSASSFFRDDKPGPTTSTAAQPPDRIQVASDSIQRLTAVARQSWNELVGYTDIEKGRARVSEQEDSIQRHKVALAAAREAHRAAVDKHAASLRETRDLLARKDDWTGEDAARFAMLHTATRAEEAEEKASRRALTEAELALERDTEKLSARIGEVYQAESMYNAKLLQVKTWWTWVLMAFNVTVFLFNVYLIQIGLNPRYRRDMDLSDKAMDKIKAAITEIASGITPNAESPRRTISLMPGSDAVIDSEEFHFQAGPEDTVGIVKERISAKYGLALSGLKICLDDAELEEDLQVSSIENAAGALRLFVSNEEVGARLFPSRPDASPLPAGASAEERFKALFSSTPVTWRMAEITTVALQSAATGAAAATLIALALWKR